MDTVNLFQVAFAFLLVIGLIALLAYLMKRFGLERSWGGVTRKPGGLRVEESILLDPRTRLMLVRHRDKGYLLLLGNSGNTVVEKNIPLEARDETVREKAA